MGSTASSSTSSATTPCFLRCRGRRSGKLQAYKRRLAWRFPWTSSLGSDFNFDFNVCFTEKQQREGDIGYNYRREAGAPLVGRNTASWQEGPVAQIAAMTGTDAAAYTRERPGMSAFVLEGGAGRMAQKCARVSHSHEGYTGRPC